MLHAARLLADQRLPGLIVVDDHDHPKAVLPASQVLRLMIPRYVQDDPALARVLDEKEADDLCQGLADKTVAEVLDQFDKVKPPVARADDTVMEIAAVMAGSRSPLVAVVEEPGETAPIIGVITVTRLMAHILPPD